MAKSYFPTRLGCISRRLRPAPEAATLAAKHEPSRCALDERHVGIVFNAIEYDFLAVGSDVEVARDEIAGQLVNHALHTGKQINLQKGHPAGVDPQHEECLRIVRK